LKREGVVQITTATAVELLIVAAAKGDDVYRRAGGMLGQSNIEIVQLDETLIFAAGEANRRYGKGRHPAALNFGDTFAYALASVRNLPLLFKGNDFARTDIVAAV
jgi:ribonuclease VapC